MFALGGERIEALQGFVDEAGMAHDEATLGNPSKMRIGALKSVAASSRRRRQIQG